jgi:hypothetical protein
MPAPDFFIRALLRIASLQGRAVLEAIITGQFEIVAVNGGKQLIASTGGGNSFSFQIPPGLTTDALMARAEEALSTFDALDSTELSQILTTAPLRKTVACFPS